MGHPRKFQNQYGDLNSTGMRHNTREDWCSRVRSILPLTLLRGISLECIITEIARPNPSAMNSREGHMIDGTTRCLPGRNTETRTSRNTKFQIKYLLCTTTPATSDRDEDEASENAKRSSRTYWTPEEDQLLSTLVSRYGPRRWKEIGKYFATKSFKQCRDRWHNQLNPAIISSPWTEEEIDRFNIAVQQYPHKWAFIATMLPGRTPTAIKNRYYSAKKKALRQESRNSTNGVNFQA